MKKNFKKLNKLQKAILITLCALSMLTAVSLIYISDSYPCDEEAISEFSYGLSAEAREVEKGIFAFGEENAKTGFIFYPGGKVDHRAYEPLMLACAEKGMLCVLVKMPFNMAFFDSNAADGIYTLFPNVESWYVGGHSLGGSMACSYAAKNVDKLEGIILLGSYSVNDLSKSELRVLTVIASEDKVVGDDYKKYRNMLPEVTEEAKLIGGCHAGFGMYGAQKGDGIPTLTSAEQIRQTAEIIADFLK